MLTMFKYLNLAIAFLLELCMLAAYSYWAFHIKGSILPRTLLAVGLPVAVVVIWGLFLAPKANIKLPVPLYVSLKTILFGMSIVLLYLSGRPTLAIIFAIVLIVNSTILYFMKQ
ncbi:MAG TPA: YrdB family protein [Flavipsychrobacter sp.]|nr:YrdB family protein [Flavipsychrobacter sp.]